jgi:hypothetical protein
MAANCGLSCRDIEFNLPLDVILTRPIARLSSLIPETKLVFRQDQMVYVSY